MNIVEALIQRNADFAAHRFTSGLKMMPSLKTIVIGCVDPRVDPAQILGIDLGEVAVIRNIGGRVTAATVQELALLRKLTEAREATSIRAGTSSSCSTPIAELFACKVSQKCWPTTSTSARTPWPGTRSPTPRQPSNSTSPPSEPPPLSRASCVSPGSSTTWRQDTSKPSSRHQYNYPPKADAGAPGSHPSRRPTAGHPRHHAITLPATNPFRCRLPGRWDHRFAMSMGPG
jgi:Carbonic anhydrase